MTWYVTITPMSIEINVPRDSFVRINDNTLVRATKTGFELMTKVFYGPNQKCETFRTNLTTAEYQAQYPNGAILVPTQEIKKTSEPRQNIFQKLVSRFSLDTLFA